jgi:hypothetical protein
MIAEHVTRALCLFLIWPLLVLRFGGNTPAPSPAPRTLRRSWVAVVPLGGRVVGVRIQLAVLPV